MGRAAARATYEAVFGAITLAATFGITGANQELFVVQRLGGVRAGRKDRCAGMKPS